MPTIGLLSRESREHSRTKAPTIFFKTGMQRGIKKEALVRSRTVHARHQMITCISRLSLANAERVRAPAHCPRAARLIFSRLVSLCVLILLRYFSYSIL
jgi:hypothetical protein